MELILFPLLIVFGLFIYWPSILLYGTALFTIRGVFKNGFKSIHGVLFGLCFWAFVILSVITLQNEWKLSGIQNQQTVHNVGVSEKFHPESVKIVFPEAGEESSPIWKRISEPVCEAICAELLLDTYVKYVSVQVYDGQPKVYRLGIAEECSSVAESEDLQLGVNGGSLKLSTGSRSVEETRGLDNVAKGFRVCALPVTVLEKTEVIFKVDDILPEAKAVGLYGHTIAAFNVADNDKMIARASTLQGSYKSFPPFPAMVCHNHGELGGCLKPRVLELDYSRVYIKSISYVDLFHNFFDMNMDGNIGNNFSPSDEVINSFLQERISAGGEKLIEAANVLSGFAQRGRLFPRPTELLFEKLSNSVTSSTSVDSILEVALRIFALKTDEADALIKKAFPHVLDILVEKPADRISSEGVQYLNGYILGIYNKYPDLFKSYAPQIEKGYFSLISLLNKRNGGSYLVSKLGDDFWGLYKNNLDRLSADAQANRQDIYHNFFLLAEIDNPRAIFLKDVMIRLIKNNDWQTFRCAVSVIILAGAGDEISSLLREEKLAQCPSGVNLDNLPPICSSLYNEQLRLLASKGSGPVNECAN